MELYGQSRAKDGLQIDRGAVWAPVRSVRGKEGGFVGFEFEFRVVS